ncbi:MAG: hypothetical protein AAF371_18055 [Pseudomonadota bacterium]
MHDPPWVDRNDHLWGRRGIVVTNARLLAQAHAMPFLFVDEFDAVGWAERVHAVRHPSGRAQAHVYRLAPLSSRPGSAHAPRPVGQ